MSGNIKFRVKISLKTIHSCVESLNLVGYVYIFSICSGKFRNFTLAFNDVRTCIVYCLLTCCFIFYGVISSKVNNLSDIIISCFIKNLCISIGRNRTITTKKESKGSIFTNTINYIRTLWIKNSIDCLICCDINILTYSSVFCHILCPK